MNAFSTQDGTALVRAMAAVIHENAAWLSDLDGAVGDGDHGINMDKGFTLALGRIAVTDDLSSSLGTLGTVLLDEIGGAMGPLYGTFFTRLARECRGKPFISGDVFAAMLTEGLSAVVALGGARVGDKTLVDVLDPATAAFRAALSSGLSFTEALDELVAAAGAGKDAAKDLVARIGRASRLGERSRGVLDAGSVSCFLLLRSMARSAQELLLKEDSHAV